MRSEWQKLLTEACRLIDHVNNGEYTVIDQWTLGGGTALMLQIEHRESHDVDLFIDDPQILPFLNPTHNNFDFRLSEPSYGGDGAITLKLSFDKIGEIDFIVAAHITDDFARLKNINHRDIQLETVHEIIAKKINYRGESIQPRDIFDIAAASQSGYDEAIKQALSTIPDKVEATLIRIEKLEKEYISNTISQLMLWSSFKRVAEQATELAVKLLRSV